MQADIAAKERRNDGSEKDGQTDDGLLQDLLWQFLWRHDDAPGADGAHGRDVLGTDGQSPGRGQKGSDRVDQILQEELRRFQKGDGRQFQKTGIFYRGSGKGDRKSQDCLKDWREAGDQHPAFIVFEPPVTINTAWPSLSRTGFPGISGVKYV